MSELEGVADICVGVGRGADIRAKFAREEICGCVERIEFACEGLRVGGDFEKFGDNDWRFHVPKERCRKAFSGDYWICVWTAEEADKIVILRGQGRFIIKGRKRNTGGGENIGEKQLLQSVVAAEVPAKVE